MASVPAKEVVDSRVAALIEYLQGPGRHQARWWHTLAATYAMLGDHAYAASLYLAAASKATKESLAGWCYHKASVSYAAAGDRQQAYATARAGIDKCWTQKAPTCSPDLLWSAALQAYHAGQYTEAVQYGEAAAAAGCFPSEASSRSSVPCNLQEQSYAVEPAAWYEHPWDVLRYAYRQIGNDSAADAAARTLTAAFDARSDAQLRGMPVTGCHHVNTLNELAATSLHQQVRMQC